MSSPTNTQEVPGVRAVKIAENIAFFFGFIAAVSVFFIVCLRAAVSFEATRIVLTVVAAPEIWAAIGLAVITGILIGGSAFALISFAQLAQES